MNNPDNPAAAADISPRNGSEEYRFPMHRRMALPVILLCLVPQQAWANAGTPLMWAAMLHLVFGNLLIGAAEGFLLSCFFGVPKRRAIPGMIGANYLSAWAGAWAIHTVTGNLAIDVNNAEAWLGKMLAATYILTLLLEWPIIAICLRDRGGRSWKAAFVLQTLSYAVLLAWYWPASRTSLVRDMTVVQPEQVAPAQPGTIFYIDDADGDVYRSDFAGRKPERIFGLNSTNWNDRLMVRSNGIDRWEIVARLDTDDDNHPNLLLITNLMLKAAPIEADDDRPETDSTWFNFGRADRLGVTTSDWSFFTGFWAAEGVRATHPTNRPVVLAFETPYAAWEARNAVHLPGDVLLFQFGRNQICLFNPNTRQVALVARGRGPLAVIEP